MSDLYVMTLPILPGKTDQWKKFAGELNTIRKNDFEESRKNLGIRERSFLQSTAHGDTAILIIEGENPEGLFKKLARKNDSFTKWYFSQLNEIHGTYLTEHLPDYACDLYADSGEPIQILQHL